MQDELDSQRINELELILKDVDVLGSPGIFWTVVGTGVVLFLFAATTVWRISYRLKAH